MRSSEQEVETSGTIMTVLRERTVAKIQVAWLDGSYRCRLIKAYAAERREPPVTLVTPFSAKPLAGASSRRQRISPVLLDQIKLSACKADR
jgi:hypothetical protein